MGLPGGVLLVTERMQGVLRILAAERRRFIDTREGNAALTCNQIGWALGFTHGMEGNRTSKTAKRMGAANRVNFAVTRLEELGLVEYARRHDGLSGSAYRISAMGLVKLTELEHA